MPCENTPGNTCTAALNPSWWKNSANTTNKVELSKPCKNTPGDTCTAAPKPIPTELSGNAMSSIAPLEERGITSDSWQLSSLSLEVMGSYFRVGKRKNDSHYSVQDDACQSLEGDNRQLMIIDVSAAHHEGEVWINEKVY